MKQGRRIFCILIAAFMFVTGCGSIPKMTDEQTELVSEYSVSLLLKYDKDNHSRLTDTSAFMTLYNTARENHDKAEAAYYENKAKEEAKRRAENEAQESANKEYEGKGKTSDSGKSKSDGTGGAKVVDATSIEDFLGLSDFIISYAGCDVLDVYPEDETSAIKSVKASQNKELLVLYFNIKNKASSKKTLDMNSLGPAFMTFVNGTSYGCTPTYNLEDDMHFYCDSFKAGETKRLVLIAEIKKGTKVNELELRITKAGKSITKTLK